MRQRYETSLLEVLITILHTTKKSYTSLDNLKVTYRRCVRGRGRRGERAPPAGQRAARLRQRAAHRARGGRHRAPRARHRRRHLAPTLCRRHRTATHMSALITLRTMAQSPSSNVPSRGSYALALVAQT